ncbi:hypothetical protein SDC9_27509 [bioreactor metagenome]|uniref:Uncharacterized protein n=1 Tax=bioreactor metagenome TaxID=1076179 RepID=A0A644URS3_9ZZZZ|nr:DUF896 domain-containing protein [Negativicutes bacterium]
MITPEIIARINELAKKQREDTLTNDERVEQTGLRRLYINNIKNQIKQSLELEPTKQPNHTTSCSCGCHGKH